MDKLVAMCRRRGFIFPGSHIYGGFANSFDYGPLGTRMKDNIVQKWKRDFITRRTDCVPLDSAVITSPQVWRTSGHVELFEDVMVTCSHCGERHRADHLVSEVDPGSMSLQQIHDALCNSHPKCPSCGSRKAGFSFPQNFNLLFKTTVGTSSDSGSEAYLRPETAQGAYINFANVVGAATNRRLPLAVAQVGKSFRNEISPGNYIFRTREFEQMELQYYCRPADAERHHAEWVDTVHEWLLSLGIKPEMLRREVHAPEDLAHYALQTTDIEFDYPFGWGELWGIANRGDYDLSAHAKGSGADLSYTDPSTNEKFVPFVIEPAVGVNRLMLALLCSAFFDGGSSSLASDESKPAKARANVLGLHPDIAPVKYAVLPIVKKQELIDVANQLHSDLCSEGQVTELELAGTVGKRYKRQDEIGTPICITIDDDTLGPEQLVTLRSRDTSNQRQMPLSELVSKGSKLYKEQF